MEINAMMMPYLLMGVIFVGAILWYVMVGAKMRGGADGLTNQYQSSLRELAQVLGLQYREVPKSAEKGVIQGGGVILEGDYKGRHIEVRFVHETREKYEGLTRTFVCTSDCGVSVESGHGAEWRVVPKNAHLTTHLTGVEAFDQALALIGPPGAVRRDQLETLGRYGWMHLEKRNGRLHFVDDYVHHVQGSKGSMAMISAVHPIWHTSMKTWNIDLPHAQRFFDQLIELAQ